MDFGLTKANPLPNLNQSPLSSFHARINSVNVPNPYPNPDHNEAFFTPARLTLNLTKAATFLKKSNATRAAILQVVYSFCPNEVAPHIAAIKALQDALGDQTTFMHCLSVLVTLESAFNEDMLDLYLYYCVIGLGMPSQQLRAACLSILPIAANQNPELVLAKLDLLEQSGQADWWEVHAQLMVIYATLLDTMESDNAQVTRRCNPST